METAVKAVLAYVLVVLRADGYKQQQQNPQTGVCLSIHPSGTHFTLTSAQNITGHWNTQLQLEHDAGDGAEGPDMGTWEVEIHQKTLTCEVNRRIIVTATITAPPPKPGPGYELIPGRGYYKMHQESLSWEEARRSCIQEGAHLIIINSEEEAKLAKQLWSHHPNLFGALYVGLHDKFTEGQFQSVLGEPMSSLGYTNWGEKEPNGSNKENCVELVIENLHFNDIGCSSPKRPYICEQEL